MRKIAPRTHLELPRQGKAQLSKACHNCRMLHLKCSGGPAPCSRCIAEGVETQCYFLPSRRGKRRLKEEPLDPSPPTSTTAPPSSIALILPSISLDPQARRSFHHFQEKTAAELSGFYDRKFWQLLVLQSSYDHAAIKHIVVALGALHEALDIAYTTWRNEGGGTLHQFSLKHCNQAIEFLKGRDQDAPLEVVLISCILFVCLETLQRNYQSAMVMLRSGVDILSKWRANTNRNQETPDEEVLKALQRLKLQSSNFFESAASNGKQRPSSLMPTKSMLAVRVDLPSSFTSLQQARTCMDALVEQSYTIMDPVLVVPDYDLTANLLRRFSVALNQYNDLLEDFLCHNWRDDVVFRREAIFLRLQYMITCIMVPKERHSDEMRFDHYLPEFWAILTLSEEFLDLSRDNLDTIEAFLRTKVSYQFELGIIPGLFVTALRCRFPVLRRKAVELLSIHYWREGAWDSRTAALVAKRVIAVEEQGLPHVRSCKEVPKANRIKILNAEPASRRTTYLHGGEQEDAQGLLLRYVRSPWDLTCYVEEMWLDMAPENSGGPGKDISSTNGGLEARTK